MTQTSSSAQKRRLCNMNAFLEWIEARIPIMRVANMHAIQYPAPKNMNFWYVFGFLATIVLVNQIITGIWLTMNFVPTSEGAFASVEYIMREVPNREDMFRCFQRVRNFKVRMLKELTAHFRCEEQDISEQG